MENQKIRIKGKKHSKKERIVFVGIIILIILIVLILSLKNLINNSSSEAIALEKLAYIQDESSWQSGTTGAENISDFLNEYNGELSSKDIAKSTYYIATELFPSYYTDLKDSSEDEILKYYEKNKEAIYINLALENSAQFTNLIKSLQSLSGENLNFESYRIDKDTIKAGANYTKAVLYITYEGNDELAINITVKNKVSSDCSSIIYKAYAE